MKCDCKQLQQQILESDVNKLSEELLSQVQACPECSRVLEQTITVCKMVALKKHESANVFVEKRYLRQLEAGLDEIDERTPAARFWYKTREVIALPQVKYAAAAAVMLVLGFQIMLVNDLPGLKTGLADAEAPKEAPVMAGAGALPTAPFSSMASSNVEYGPVDGAVPVKLLR